MYPDRDTSNVPRSGYITVRDQSMVESGVTEGGKNSAKIRFRESTQQGLKLKATVFKVIPEEKQRR